MPPQAYAALQPFLDKLELRTSLGREEREAFLALPFIPKQVRPNLDFVRDGQRVEHSCFVLDGLVGAFKQDKEGNRQIVSIYINGDMVDLHTVVLPEAISALQALTPTTILQVPHEALRQAGRCHPALAEAFWRQCVIDAGILMEWVVNVGRRDARTRMAHFLCELACRSIGKPENGMTIPYSITQFQMSDVLSLTAVHINRTLQSLRQAGLIESVERSMQRIVNWEGLVSAGDFDPNYLRLAASPTAQAA